MMIVNSQLLSKKVRRKARLAEEQQWHCVWCNQIMRLEFGWRNSATFEHLIPKNNKGTANTENIKISCQRCNRLRGLMPVDEFISIAIKLPPDITYLFSKKLREHRPYTKNYEVIEEDYNKLQIW